MERLFTYDVNDYDPSWPHITRPSIRGIIERDGKFAMIYNGKYDYYMFPGGGMEEGESQVETLIREVKEETGLVVIPESIKEFGSALRLLASRYRKNTIFEQENYYYWCEVEDTLETTNFDVHETEEQYSLEYVSLEEALKKNLECDHGEEITCGWIQRESKMFQLLLELKKN